MNEDKKKQDRKEQQSIPLTEGIIKKGVVNEKPSTPPPPPPQGQGEKNKSNK